MLDSFFQLVRIIVLKCWIINVLIVQSPYLLTTNTVKGASKTLLIFLINFGDIDSLAPLNLHISFLLPFFVSLPERACGLTSSAVAQ